MRGVLIIRRHDPDELLHGAGEVGVLFVIQIHISLGFRRVNLIVYHRRVCVQMFDQRIADDGNPHPELGETIGGHGLIQFQYVIRLNTRLPADGVNAFPGIIMGAQHHEGGRL